MLQLPPVIGHRGARGHAPENTLASLKKAAELGVSWVEFDVMLAECGTPVIIHDITLERTTDGTGEVGHIPYTDLITLDAGSWFSPAFAGEHIPTLVEMIAGCGLHNLAANIEIKPYPGTEIATALKVIEIVMQAWPTHLPQPLLSSFSIESLKTVRNVSKTCSLGLLLDTWDVDWIEIATALNCVSVHQWDEIVDEQHVQQIKAAGFFPLVYTVNEKQRYEQLRSWGVVSVFSDYPDRLL